MKKLWDKIKQWFDNVFKAVKSGLSNFKLWLVKNIDFIKKCLVTAFIGLMCLCVMPFACNSNLNTAKADTLDGLTDTAIIYNIGNYFPAFVVGTTGSSTINLNLELTFGLEFDYYTNSVYMLLPTNHRIDLTNVTSEDGSSTVDLPSVFNGDVYNSAVQSSYIVLSITNTSINVFEEDFINSPTWSVYFAKVTDTSFNIVIQNDTTGGGVIFTAFLTYQGTIRNYVNNLSSAYSFNPLIYLTGGDTDSAYHTGYNDGYNNGYTDGAEVGYDNAINDGKSQGFFSSIASMVTDLVSVEIFPGIPISYVILIAFGLLALRIILNLFAT